MTVALFTGCTLVAFCIPFAVLLVIIVRQVGLLALLFPSGCSLSSRVFSCCSQRETASLHGNTFCSGATGHRMHLGGVLCCLCIHAVCDLLVLACVYACTCCGACRLAT